MINYSCHNYLRTKIVIKTIEISFLVSGLIRPPSKSKFLKSTKSETLSLLWLHNGAIV